MGTQIFQNISIPKTAKRKKAEMIQLLGYTNFREYSFSEGLLPTFNGNLHDNRPYDQSWELESLETKVLCNEAKTLLCMEKQPCTYKSRGFRPPMVH